jgi:hypothetical protein
VYVVVLVVALAVVVATYLTWLAMRIDRLGSRVRGARAALDVQLERRADAAREAAERAGPEAAPVREAAMAALTAPGSEREAAESGLTRALRATTLVAPATPRADEPQADGPRTDKPQADGPRTDGPQTDELRTEVARVAMARQFHNDAVRDLRTLRGRWLVRYLHLGGRSPLPGYFEIDDDVTLPVATYSGAAPGAGPVPGPGSAQARPGQPSHT